MISADGASVSTYAGSGAAALTNETQALQAALDTDLSAPQRMTLAPDGRLFFTDLGSNRIHVIEIVSSTSENFGSVSLGAGFQGAGTHVIGAQNLFFDAEGDDLTFSILSGNEDGLFAIDAASGRVTLAVSLTDTHIGINTLVIQAQDLAGSATVTLTIVVEDVSGDSGGGGGCSLQSATNHPIDTTLWWLLLLSLALLTVRAYTTRRPQKNL